MTLNNMFTLSSVESKFHFWWGRICLFLTEEYGRFFSLLSLAILNKYTSSTLSSTFWELSFSHFLDIIITPRYNHYPYPLISTDEQFATYNFKDRVPEPLLSNLLLG